MSHLQFLKLFCARFFPSLAFIFSILFLAGCSVTNDTATNTVGTSASPTATPTATPPPGTGQVTSQSNITTFQVSLQSASGINSTISKWTSGSLVGGVDGVTPCTATLNEDALCVVDMDELDLYFRGYTLTDTVPSSLCAYRAFTPYFYAIAPVGNAPLAVAYTVDANKSIAANTSTVGGTLPSNGATPNNVDIWYLIFNEANSTLGWWTHKQLYGALAVKDTDVKCPFDYTGSNGKNCCQGTYTLAVTNTTGQTNTQVAWGGKPGNCFEGPGMDLLTTLPIRSDGLPAVYVTNAINPALPSAGLSTSITISPPIGNTTKGQRQIYAANYYTLAANGADVPTATRVTRSAYTRASMDSSVYFDYDCLDAAFEVQSRIRVLVRRWSTNTEFQKFLASKGLSGNPELAGNETPPTHSDPNNTNGAGPNIDFCNWDDWTGTGVCDNTATFTNFGFLGTATAAQAGLWQDRGTFTYLGFPPQ
ncbi:MAG: hypothetical protein JWQ35_1726 [Bacteriovoracaceae bacterium]|nr:hypothetical protein [Bacteriovoracaceae bacterium]